MPPQRPPLPAAHRPHWPGTWTLAALAALLAWDASGLDPALAHWVGDRHGFAWRDHWWLTQVLHDGGRRASWAFALLLCVGVWWPWGPLRRLLPGQRLYLALAPLLAAAAVTLLKGISLTSCPWDLQEFGGVARYVSHWERAADGGGGHCFPAGHAASGFSFVGGFFAFRGAHPATARRWLGVALATGLLFGVGQQLRGAHFMSHTLWTGWICWTVSAGVHELWPRSEEPA